jgi:predicted AlkP superfamily phosphohydrolase/phosphomutase
MMRAFILGLDGATFHVLDDLVRAGVMPNLAAFMARSTRAVLRSTVPPLTPVAWSTLVTGRTAGNHGVTGFFQYAEPDSFALRIVSARELRAETLWSIVNRYGMRAGSLNFPIHSPPPRIDGYVIPGWVPWKWIRRFSHPSGVVDRLHAAIPALNLKELAMDFEQERIAISGVAVDDPEEWINLHSRRDRQWFEVLLHQLQADACELAGIVIDGVDKVQHLLWPYLDADPAAYAADEKYVRIREMARGYFRHLDGLIGDLLAVTGDECTVFVVSDHGFTGTSEILHINTWLEREGYLTWQPDSERVPEGCYELEPDFYHLSAFNLSSTRAFALTASSNGIHIVVQGRRSTDGVRPEDYETFRRELMRRLLTGCVHPETGEPLIARIWTREEVFAGPYMNVAPDLTLQLRDHGFFSVRRSDQLVSKRREVMGTHHPDGILLASGPGVKSGCTLHAVHLTDIAPTILHTLGLEAPEEMDGRVIQEMFTDGYRRTREWRAPAPVYAAAAAAADVEEVQSHDHEAEILERLRALGYIE